MLDPASDELERLAVVSGVDIGQLAMAVLRTENGGGWVNGFVMDGVSLPREWLLPGLRICPACLADSPHHRRRWHLGALGTCPDHGEHLIAKCPGCRARLTWQRGLLPHCHCGADLRRQASVDAALDEADGWLWDLGQGRRGPHLLAAWPFVPAIEFAAAVGEVLLGKRAGVALVAPAGVGVGCLQAGYRALDGDMERLDLTSRVLSKVLERSQSMAACHACYEQPRASAANCWSRSLFCSTCISRKPGSRWWPPFLARRSVKRDVVRLGVVFRPGQRILADGMPFHELDGECIAGNYLSGQRSLQGFVAAVAGFTWQRMCEIVLFQWVGTVRFICRATVSSRILGRSVLCCIPYRMCFFGLRCPPAADRAESNDREATWRTSSSGNLNWRLPELASYGSGGCLNQIGQPSKKRNPG